MREERRRKRSDNPTEALRLLLRTVRDRSDVTSIAVIDARGLVVAGTGPERELLVLGAVAAPAASGAFDRACERLTMGTDVLSCPLALEGETMYLAALGERVSRMPEAVRSATRILRHAQA